METPPLYRQLQTQLRQWFKPKDKRHLQGVSEAIAAILQSGSACLSHWLPFLRHRDCNARAHMGRLSYLVNNEAISAARFYEPLLRHTVQALAGESIILTLDTSMLWDRFCLIEVCLAWGGRSITLAQTVIEHGSATIGFEQYQPILETVKTVLPPNVSVTFLADRGFEHGALMRWLNQHQWDWVIRAKGDLLVTLPTGRCLALHYLFPPAQEVYLFHQVTILTDIECHVATANIPDAEDTWGLVSSQPTSLQSFALYGQRFGGIEPHFKDYKSAAFDILRSQLRDPAALTCLLMLLDCAALIALILGLILVLGGQRSRVDWHGQRGLSFLQLGLRHLSGLGYERLPMPSLICLTKHSPPAASASKRKQDFYDCRIEFRRVSRFSG